MSRLYIFSLVALAALASTACAPRTTTRPAGPSASVVESPVSAASTTNASSAASATSTTPVGRYRFTRGELIRSTRNDSIYRFTDGTPATVSVIRYDVPENVKVGADPQAWTTPEGERFEEVQSILLQQGRIQSFEKAFSTTSDVVVDNAVLREHAIAIAVRPSGTTRMDYQYLYVVGGRFLKVRGTFPGDSWKNSDFPEFAREVARRTYRAAR